jgi:hypothetical protein
VFSISRCAVIPTFLRNFRTLMLKSSSFMVPPYGSGPLKDKAGVRFLPRVSHS